MSRERFLRCKHCGFPHEVTASVCPLTGKAIEHRPSSAPPSAKAAPHAGYRWKHTVQRADPGADAPAIEPDALVGRTIDSKYRIEELVGRGGMGAVYRAENTRIGKQVAIKILVRAYAKGSDAEKRFYREARIAGSLGHPNIVEIFDLGTLEDGAPYQVMELLEGRTLSSRLELEGALPIDDALDIADQVLSALGAAHQKGVVHRDLKPDNIFLANRGGVLVVKLLDFGISKNLTRGEDETMSLTRTGAIVGTPYYLSPEQARGDRVDPRADVWAMGVVLYEILTGELPFSGENYNKLMVKILTTRPRPPREIRPALPEAVEAFVLRALAHDANDRFQNVLEMRRSLRMLRGRELTRSVADDLALDVRAHDDDDEDPTEISDRFRFADLRKSRD